MDPRDVAATSACHTREASAVAVLPAAAVLPMASGMPMLGVVQTLGGRAARGHPCWTAFQARHDCTFQHHPTAPQGGSKKASRQKEI